MVVGSASFWRVTGVVLGLLPGPVPSPPPGPASYHVHPQEDQQD